MSDDYLWDRSGPEDPDVAHVERVLGRLRAPEPPPPLTLPVSPAARMPRLPVRWFVLPIAAAATVAIVALNVWLAWHPPAPSGSFQVSRLDGSPRIASTPIADATGQLPVGEWLETDASARARIRVAHIGRVDVEPQTRVGLVSTRPGDYRLRLDRGTVQAVIVAPPGQFRIETPTATAIDLGCAYTLRVQEDGESLLQVTSGWVALQGRTRTSMVRAGWMAIARAGSGPGTPFRMDVSPAFREALHAIDADVAGDASRAGARGTALDRVLADARPIDSITLWHLLPRVERTARDRVFDRLAAFAPPPAGVTRDGIRDGDPGMLDRWWNGARLGPSTRVR